MSAVITLVNTETHLFAGIAIVRMANKQATIGSDLKSTMLAYQQSLTREVAGPIANEKTSLLVSGTVFRIASTMGPDGTSYSVILRGSEKTIFTAQSARFPYLQFTNPGDSVNIRYMRQMESQIIPMDDFSNLTIEHPLPEQPSTK